MHSIMHRFSLSLSLSLFFLEDERGGRLFPSQVFARGKDSKGRGGEGRKKRGKEETTRDFLHTIRITGSRASGLICFSFRALLFLSPSLISPPPSLFFPFPPVHLSLLSSAIKTTASVFSVPKNLRGKQPTMPVGQYLRKKKREK